MTEEKKATAKKPAAEMRRLTPSQKAEAAALWRAGTVTLEDLGKRFKKRPEAFSRLFKRMGIEKGSTSDSVEKRVKRIEAEVEARIVSSVDETLRRIAATKEDHYRYSQGIAKLVWAELVRARQAGIDIGSLKDVMATLKLAGDVIGGARKELFEVLDVEKHSKTVDLDDLPELTVRELTQSEIGQLRTASTDDMGIDEDAGADMLPDDLAEGL